MSDSNDVYTHGHHDSVLRSHRWRTAANSAAYLLPYLRPGMTLLDVGCGPGTLTVDLAGHVAPGAVTGIDLEPTVLESARAVAQDRNATNVEFASGDFRTLGLAHDAFDVVHAHQVLQHLRDPQNALREMARLAKPGGVVAARDADYSAMTWYPADERLDQWLAVYLAVTRRNGAQANAGRHLPAWAHQAGLTDAVFTTSTWTFSDAVDRAWWSDLWAERCVASAFAHQAVDYGVATEAELAEIAEGWRDWAVHPDAVFVVMHGEIVCRV